MSVNISIDYLDIGSHPQQNDSSGAFSILSANIFLLIYEQTCLTLIVMSMSPFSIIKRINSYSLYPP